MNTSSVALPLPRYDLPKAGRALRALLRDPDDLPQVFTLIDSMSGTGPHRLLRGFLGTESGKQILKDRRDIVPLLSDRVALRALPEGTLGRAYLAFVESEGISPEGILDASNEGEGKVARSETLTFLRQRMRDTHDLWHAATGYKGDVLGEISLLAFSLAQHWNIAIAMIVVAALVKGYALESTKVILDGYRRGRAAAWLPAQDWESMLAMPVEEVRARLKLGAAPVYTPVRSSELRAVGLV